ncbi:hypothetical protein GMYAFLOJ_CDS0006 [Microbacterium phage phiMiGM15]
MLAGEVALGEAEASVGLEVGLELAVKLLGEGGRDVHGASWGYGKAPATRGEASGRGRWNAVDVRTSSSRTNVRVWDRVGSRAKRR